VASSAIARSPRQTSAGGPQSSKRPAARPVHRSNRTTLAGSGTDRRRQPGWARCLHGLRHSRIGGYGPARRLGGSQRDAAGTKCGQGPSRTTDLPLSVRQRAPSSVAATLLTQGLPSYGGYRWRPVLLDPSREDGRMDLSGMSEREYWADVAKRPGMLMVESLSLAWRRSWRGTTSIPGAMVVQV